MEVHSEEVMHAWTEGMGNAAKEGRSTQT